MKILKHFKAPLRVLAVFLILLIIAYILITQTNLPERVISRSFKKMVGDKYDVVLSVDDISGSLISGMRLKDIFLHYQRGDSLIQIAYISGLKVEYSLTDFWRQQWIIRSVHVDQLEFGIHDELLEKFKGGGDKGETTGLPEFRVEELIIEAAQIRDISGEKNTLAENIHLDLALLREQNKIQARIDSFSFAFSYMDFDVNQISGLFTLEDSSLFADSVEIRTLGSRIDFDAQMANIEQINYRADLRQSSFDLLQIGNLFDTELEGEIVLSGPLQGNEIAVGGDLGFSGNIFGRQISKLNSTVEYSGGEVAFYDLRGGALGANLQGDGLLDFVSDPNEYLFSGRMNDFNLNDIIDNTFNTSFTGVIILNGSSFSSDDMEISIRAELDSGYFDIYPFDSIYGDADIYDDSIIFREPINALFEGTRASAEGIIEYEGDISIQGSAQSSDLQPFMIQYLTLEDMGGRGQGQFRFQGPIDDPSLIASFISDSAQAYNVVSDSLGLAVNFERFATILDGSIDLSSGAFHYDRYNGDRLTGRLIFDSNLLIADSVDLVSPRLTSQFDLIADISDTLIGISVPRFNAVIDTFTIRAVDRMEFTVSDTSWYINRLALATDSGSLDLQGSVVNRDQLDFAARCRNLNLAPILSFYVPEPEFEGIVGFRGELTGTMADPIIDLEGRTQNTYMYGQSYGDLSFSLDYSDSLITVDSIVLRGEDNLTKASGTIPLNLTLRAAESRLVDDKQMDMEIASRGTSYYLLPVVLPDIEWIEGENLIDLKINGTPNDPYFDGTYHLRNGRVKVYYLENVLENVHADLSFEDRYIISDSMTTELRHDGRPGFAVVTGNISLESIFKPELDLNVQAENFPFRYDLGDIEGVIDEADIVIFGRDTVLAVGDVALNSFFYGESFEPAIEVEAMQVVQEESAFNYNLDITIPSNLKVVNQDFNAELGGDLKVIKEGDFINFLGTLETLRGKYYFFDQTFTVLPNGEIRFNNIDEFNPELNIIVETSIIQYGERLKARLLLSGTLLEPQLTATADSEVGENQFMEYITFQRLVAPGDEQGSEFDKRLSYGVQEIAMNRLANFLGRRIGLEVLEINPYYEGDEMILEQAEIRLGLYPTANLYIYGATELDLGQAREVGFEYRFSRRLFISGERDEDDLYHLNLNLNWDF